MANLSFQTNITTEQLFSLLMQLPAKEKMEIARVLRAEAVRERWSLLSESLPDVADQFSMDEIIEEVKTVRKNRTGRKKQ